MAESITVSEVDRLTLKCAELEFQLGRNQLEQRFTTLKMERDKIVDPIIDRYKNGSDAEVEVNLQTGELIFRAKETAPQGEEALDQPPTTE